METRHVFSVGLTGGIGCGKTTVADLFAGLGAAVIDTDDIARALTAPGGAAPDIQVTVSRPIIVGYTIHPGDQLESEGNAYGTTQIVENFFNLLNGPLGIESDGLCAIAEHRTSRGAQKMTPAARPAA